MKDPYLLAWTLSGIAFGAVWAYVYVRFRLSFRSYCVMAATCMPVWVSLRGYAFFVGDLIGIALLLGFFVRLTPRFRKLRHFGPPVIGLWSVGLIAWPLIATYLSVTYLNETAQPSTLAFFVLRSAAQLGFFLWAARTGATVPSVKPLLSIPAAFWLVFAAIGILQFTKM